MSVPTFTDMCREELELCGIAEAAPLQHVLGFFLEPSGEARPLPDDAFVADLDPVVGPQRAAGGTFGDLNLPTLTDGAVWDVSQFSTTGIIFVVPEPSRFMLVALGFMALGLRRRRSSVKTI